MAGANAIYCYNKLNNDCMKRRFFHLIKFSNHTQNILTTFASANAIIYYLKMKEITKPP
jgi:hypothetical protein